MDVVRVGGSTILNFRKLRQDFPSNILKEGKSLYDQALVEQAKILSFDGSSLKISGQVKGNFDNVYESFIEIDRVESELVDSDCDCPYHYDCAHLSALLFYLEEHFEEILVAYSREADLEEAEELDEEEKEELQQTFQEAKSKQAAKQDQAVQKEILQEYITACGVLGDSPFFQPKHSAIENSVQISLIVSLNSQQLFDHRNSPEIQVALRLPHRSKPISIPHISQFLDAVRFNEPVVLGGRKYFFGFRSFEEESREILHMILHYARFREGEQERNQKVVQIDSETFGNLLSRSFDMAMKDGKGSAQKEGERVDRALPCLFLDSLETPLRLSSAPAQVHFELDYLETPSQKLLFQPYIQIDDQRLELSESHIFKSAKPGVIYKGIYYRFPPEIRRGHLKSLPEIRDMTIPEPLFGSFIEYGLPEMLRFAEVSNREVLERFVTLPFSGPLKARCDLEYLNGELEASLFFLYEDREIPACEKQWEFGHLQSFIDEQGILARDLVAEKKLIEDLFEDFIHNPKDGKFVAKTEKKIVEFMTGTVLAYQEHVDFRCPENLLEQFIYDDTHFTLDLDLSPQTGNYQLTLSVNGHLEGAKIDQLWDCVSSKRSYIELERGKRKKGRKATSAKTSQAKLPKILVMNLEKVGPLIRIFDEIGIQTLSNQTELCPIWSLASLKEEHFEGLPVSLNISPALQKLQEQILDGKEIEVSPFPKEIQATLRSYQQEGVAWLDRLRKMHLGGALADDMGLGKTLQAISAITQVRKEYKEQPALVVCPTSLTYNWKEECHKFNPNLKVLVIDGSPVQRKKLIAKASKYDILISSYSLLQKDIEHYESITFCYAILDEAQHIKNRTTLNARSVKEIKAIYRLVLTGTPVENSLEELWSIFDFLMPGLLSSYERFVERFIRSSGHFGRDSLETLKRKVAPFILRRMKQDVLKDLPPVSEIVYHCELTPVQRDLYQSYARSAREELTKLVEKEGFQKVQIHVLATLTRLKQICCHPAIFAKDQVEMGDSAKYEMFQEMLHGLIDGGHKTVIFSQYTRMLQIIRADLEAKGIPFSYLDGSTKNRLAIVKEFNQNEKIPVFLVSLKAGGSGLNLVGADTVLHYDMWWNPAVEAQATDRVHRLGQTKPVSSYRIITSGTIEEKILRLHERKKGLVKQVINSDEDAIAKLTWEDVLELLQT